MVFTNQQDKIPVIQDEQGLEICCSLHLLVMRMMLYT